MAGFAITTDLSEKQALALARDVADELGFNVKRNEKWSLQATKGNLALSIFVGAFVAYCDFEIVIEEGRKQGQTRISIHRNSPWWTGIIGIGRVKKRAKELVEALADAIEDEGGKVLQEREF